MKLHKSHSNNILLSSPVGDNGGDGGGCKSRRRRWNKECLCVWSEMMVVVVAIVIDVAGVAGEREGRRERNSVRDCVCVCVFHQERDGGRRMNERGIILGFYLKWKITYLPLQCYFWIWSSPYILADPRAHMSPLVCNKK